MKRFLSIILSVLMLVSVNLGMSISAFASEKKLDSGKIGDNITWQVSEVNDSEFKSGKAIVLTISGKGEVPSYKSTTNKNSAPWYKNAISSIDDIIINEGVTSLGENLFLNENNLRSITLPKTFRGIDNNTFENCSGLSEVKYNGTSSEFSNYYNFFDCKESYTSNKNVKFVCEDKTLYSVEVTGLSGECGESLTYSIDVDTKTLTIKGKGEMYNFIDSTQQPWANYTFYIENIVISSGVTSIGDYAFALTPAESIIIPKTVTSIGYGAFENCQSLKEVYFEGSQNVWNYEKIDENNDGLKTPITNYSLSSTPPLTSAVLDSDSGVMFITTFGGLLVGCIGTIFIYRSKRKASLD